MANGKEQMANVKQFEFCHLPFEMPHEGWGEVRQDRVAKERLGHDP
jgi:hypothetical protein